MEDSTPTTKDKDAVSNGPYVPPSKRLAAIRTVRRGPGLALSEEALRGLSALTEREREITMPVATGLTNDEIAGRSC